MPDLHDLLERESERFTLRVGAADRMFERGRRRGRNRRLVAIGVGALLFLAVLAIVRFALPNGDEPRPALPTPVTPKTVAGTYRVELNSDDDVQRLHLLGTYELRLDRRGTMQLSSHHGFDLPGAPITFTIEDGVMTTDALVGSECDAPGRYRMSLEAGALSFRPVEEPCELRRVLLASRPWTGAVEETSERLEGDWTATFSCERMVRTVRAAATPGREAFWARIMARELGSADPTDPCAAGPTPMRFTLRFSNGHVWVFDGQHYTEGFDGGYEQLSRNVVRFGDSIDGPFRARFRIEGDRVTFDLIGRGGSQPFFVGTWESAPFVKRP